MSYFAGNARIKTATLFAFTFLVLAIGIGRELSSMDGFGFLAVGMMAGSPLTWVEAPVKSLLRWNNDMLILLVLAPYPILGWLIGYYWPLRDAGYGRLAGAVLLRFAMTWVPIVAIGLWRSLSR